MGSYVFHGIPNWGILSSQNERCCTRVRIGKLAM